MVDWGDPIEVNGQRPDWLRDGSKREVQCRNRAGDWLPVELNGEPSTWHWGYVSAIRLPVDHVYYLATSKGFTYWPGSERAPDDWNGSKVLLRNGVEIGSHDVSYWKHVRGLPGGDIIGYRKRAADKCCNRTVQVGHRCAGCPHDDETSNHMVAAPASYRGAIDVEAMWVPETPEEKRVAEQMRSGEPKQPTITPEFIALVVNERDALRKRVTDLLEANNRLVEEVRDVRRGFERSEDELATVRTKLDMLTSSLRELAA